MRTLGTVIRGIRMPVFQTGDDIVKLVVENLKNSWENEGYQLRDRDVVGITESVVARAQGNYASVDQLAKEVRSKFGSGKVGLIFPILSRNRFLVMLKAIAQGVDELIIQLSYPSDEVGNPLVSYDQLDEFNINPYTDEFSEEEFRKMFPDLKHPFTGTDYVDMYKSVSNNVTIVFSNKPSTLLQYTNKILVGDIHTRVRTKRLVKKAGAKIVFGLDDLLTSSVDGSGYNPLYGVLGSNLSSNGAIKLFPRDAQPIVDEIQKKLKECTGKTVEVFVYGDGAFKDPFGKIWELADPVVSPAFTPGLKGTPNELKFKFIADTELGNLKGEEARVAMEDYIQKNKSQKSSDFASLGTTPRNLTDLLGSLCDLTSGSGDKGTPVVLVQGYFDDYTKK